MSISRPKVLVIIPARWGSTRFPGKPLHPIAGKPLVQRVWERCLECQNVDKVVLATDDDRIADSARRFDAHSVKTADYHPSGTDRVAEAAGAFPPYQIIINVQGDEPLISPALIDELAEQLIADATLPMITAASPLTEPAALEDPNIVKVAVNLQGDALYFSRSRIPFPRHANPDLPTYRHHGIYGFQRAFLFQFVKWAPSPLEKIESLEQLRALDHGARIRVIITPETSPGVDTPEQAAEVERLLLSQSSANPR